MDRGCVLFDLVMGVMVSTGNPHYCSNLRLWIWIDFVIKVEYTVMRVMKCNKPCVFHVYMLCDILSW